MKRRQFIAGVGGAMLGLPFLASLRRWRGQEADAGAKADRAAGDKRMVIFFTCNGANMNTFFPTTPFGALTPASFANRAIAPLAPFASKLLIPRGIHAVPYGFGWDPGGGDDHAKGMAHKLTARPIRGEFASGISVDQFAARSLHADGQPALTLKVGDGGQNATLRSISYTAANAPVIGETHPFRAYQDLIGISNEDPQVRERLLARRESVLDLCGAEYDELLRQDLSTEDRQKLDMHFAAVRQLEDGIGGTCAGLDQETLAELTALPTNVTGDSFYKQIGRLQLDVIAIAIACGATKVASVQWGNGSGGPIFRWDGMNHPYNHHKLSHGLDSDTDTGTPVEGYEGMLSSIDDWHAQNLAYLLGRLDSYSEGDGTVLDNSIVMWANELSNGKAHDFRDLPFVLAGSAGGYFKQGQYINVSTGGTKRPNGPDDRNTGSAHNKLLTTMLNAVGVRQASGDPIENFGDTTVAQPGEFTQLKA